MAVPQFIAAQEGFDIYGSGNIPANYPWFVTDATKQGQINASAGAFGGCALTFPSSGAGSSLASGFEYQFPSTMSMIRGNTANGGKGAFAINGWLNISTMSAGSGTLLSLGTAGVPGSFYPLLNISNTSAGGTNLQFITNINSPTSAPYNFNIQLNTYYWVQMQFAYYSPSSTASAAVLTASYTINGAPLLTDTVLTWSADAFSGSQLANRLKFYASNFISYLWDDIVIQAVSNNDTNWPLGAGVNPTPETVPAISARRIYALTATGNGSLTQMAVSGGEPNWQAATDPTGSTNYVTATDVGQTDLYKWNAPAMSDIRAVSIRGNSNRYQNLNGSFKTSAGGTLTQMPTNNGASRYIGIAETDGTNAWTTASINAAEFGQTSK
jgi:hypothetical protein